MRDRSSLIVAAAQPACAPGDLAATARAHADAIRAARARLVVFPELSLTGYELDAPTVAPDDPALRPVVAACAETGAVALAGAPVRGPGEGGPGIAVLRIDGHGASVAYRKMHLGGDEAARFVAGDGPAVLDLDGWRVGLAVCRDTGVEAHTTATAALGVDLYAAGLVHRPDELAEQDRRGRHVATTCRAPVAFASFAGAAGTGYARTAGRSTIWDRDGAELARAGTAPGEIARATLHGAGRGGSS